MAKKRDTGKKRRNRRRRSGHVRMVLALFCTVVTVAAMLCADTVFFRVGEIRVVGTSPYSDEEIISATGIQTGGSLIFFEKNRAIRQLFDACPYLETVRIRRCYPDTLEILVTQSTPMAVVKSGDGAYILSTSEVTSRWSRSRISFLYSRMSGEKKPFRLGTPSMVQL